MRICLAQTQPITGNVEANIAAHLQLIDGAVAHQANLVLFPELSITGYEPTLAQDLATIPEDSRFAVFQKISNKVPVLADFKPTSRNRMMLVAFRFANFVEVEKHEEYVLLQNDLTQIQQFPEYINVTIIN